MYAGTLNDLSMDSFSPKYAPVDVYAGSKEIGHNRTIHPMGSGVED